MADISKITLLDGQAYDIKDAVARAAIPAAATATPQMDGSAAVGTSTKYAKEDHRHPRDTSLFFLECKGTSIAKNTDLNDLKTPGNYYCASLLTAPTILNSPPQKDNYSAFKLEVIEVSSTYEKIMQLMMPLYEGSIYYRFYWANQWSDWLDMCNPTTVNGHTVESDVPTNAVFTDTTYTPASNAPLMNGTAAVGTSTKYAREDHVHPADTSLISAELTGTELVNGDNLNLIETTGNYYFIGDGTIDNSPTDGKFKMVVIKTGVTSFGADLGAPCQILFADKGSNSTIYYRYHNAGSTWRDWQSIRNSSTVNGHTVLSNVPANAVFTDTTYTPASSAPGKVASASSTGTSTNYARQDHTHGIDLATGDANGQVKIAGQNVSVKGLGSLAYADSVTTVNGHTVQSDVPTNAVFTDTTYTPASSTPLMDGTAAIGTSDAYAREDHVHPTDNNTFTLIPVGSEIAQNSDLNDIVTPGSYFNTTGDTSTINNTPSQAGNNPGVFKLVVLKCSRLNTVNGLIYQFFFSGDASGGTIYMRSRSTTQVWTEWVCLTNPNMVNGHTVQSDVPANAVFTDTTYTPASANPLMDGTAAVGTSTKYAREDHVHPRDSKVAALEYNVTEINTGDDLDDYITPGTYYCATATIASNVSNIPEGVGAAFKLYVIGIIQNRYYQLLLFNNDAHLMFYRYYYDGSWFSWHEVDNPSKVNGHTVLSNVPANLAFNCLYYGECSTAAATVAKTVTLTNGDGFSLVEGAKICVRFEYANSASSPTLNVNDTGAKAIVRFGTTVIGTTAGGTGNWSNGGMVLFIYDGTSWVEHYWNNTTYSSMTVSEYTAGTAGTGRLMTAARLKAAIKLHSAPDVYTATIPTTGWTTASYGAYIDVTFTGATFAADDTVFVDLNLSSDTNLQLINDSWACLLRATPTASSAIIRFKFREIPTVAIPVRAVVK